MAAKPDWLSDLQDDLDALGARQRLRRLTPATSFPNHRIEVDGQSYMNLAANDYLGFGGDLALHHEFLQTLANEDQLSQMGLTASASRLLGGEHPALNALETLLAESYGHARQALVFNSGYHANTGILPALAGRDDLILSDRLVHASLIDGIRLCRSQWLRYRHNDMEHLRYLLAQKASGARRVFIVTESIFSMDGDMADLQKLVELKNLHGAVLYVDEAHAVGVRGPHGLGLAAEQGVLEHIDILIGTFGKALASVGAYCIAPIQVRKYLINFARTLIFTTALPPAIIWWSCFVWRAILQADQRRADLATCARQFRTQLGFSEQGTHIVPYIVGTDDDAVALSKQLREQGYWVPPIRPPTVPEGTARLRFSLGAQMDRDELAALAATVCRLKEKL